MSRLERAIQMALTAHAGQTDKSGQPYILHCLRVMLAQESEEARIVAVLHDVVEDTHVTVADVQAEFGGAIAMQVEILTRHRGQPYDEYIQRVYHSRAATHCPAIKIADLRDNLSPARILDTPKLPQYIAALRLLEAAR